MAITHYRHHDVKPFRRINGFIQMRQHSVGFVPEDVDCEFTVFECGLQSAQFVDQAKAGDKQGDFGCVKQELFLLLGSRLRRAAVLGILLLLVLLFCSGPFI